MTRREERFWWFQGESVRTLYDRLGAADPDTARLEVRIDKDDRMTFQIVPAGVTTAEGDPPVNDSHRCPPDCP